MKNELEYYYNVIKPIENKYNRYCRLYKIFTFKWIKEKRNFYNSLLLKYYKMVQNNNEYSNNL